MTASGHLMPWGLATCDDRLSANLQFFDPSTPRGYKRGITSEGPKMQDATGTGFIVRAVVFPIKVVILTVTTVLWTVIGFAFWVPLLLRATALFSAMVLYSTLTRSDPRLVQAQLHQAIEFYPRGFPMIWASLGRTEYPGEGETPLDGVRLGRFIMELFWAIIVWAAFIILLDRIGILGGPLHEAMAPVWSFRLPK